MSKKTLVIGLACCFMVCGFMLPTLQASKVPCKVTITAPEGEKPHPRFGQVEMSHKGHKALQCSACHHMFDGCGEFDKCTNCHLDRDARSDANSFYNAWHGASEISCRGCHKAMKADGKKTGPVACLKGCHEEKKK